MLMWQDLQHSDWYYRGQRNDETTESEYEKYMRIRKEAGADL